MKVKIDKPTAEHLRSVIGAGLNFSRDNLMLSMFLHEQLTGFSDRLRRPWNSRTKTLAVSCSLAVALQSVLDLTSGYAHLEPSRLLMRQYVMETIYKQLNDMRYGN